MGTYSWLGVALGCSLLVACGDADSEEDEFTYDRADVEAALLGTWRGTWASKEEEAVPFELEVRAADEPPLGGRCDNRELAAPGLSVQCVSMSSMPVSATAVVGSTAPMEFDGGVTIPSLNLSEIWLSLSGEEAPFVIDANWDDVEGFRSCSAQAGGEIIATCTLDERLP